jgi:hypothetical protein
VGTFVLGKKKTRYKYHSIHLALGLRKIYVSSSSSIRAAFNSPTTLCLFVFFLIYLFLFFFSFFLISNLFFLTHAEAATRQGGSGAVVRGGTARGQARPGGATGAGRQGGQVGCDSHFLLLFSLSLIDV